MTAVDLPADLNSRDEDGLCWSFLDEARDPAVIIPGAVIIAGDADAPAFVEVVDTVEIETGTIVRFRILPGAVDEYEAVLARNRRSA